VGAGGGAHPRLQHRASPWPRQLPTLAIPAVILGEPQPPVLITTLERIIPVAKMQKTRFVRNKHPQVRTKAAWLVKFRKKPSLL